MIRRVLDYFNTPSSLLSSRLFNEQTFYHVFIQDLAASTSEIIIESPFITTKRLAILLPNLRNALHRGVSVTINTRDPKEQDTYMRLESEATLAILQSNGIKILFTGGHHRKLAIVDRKVLWEGSLNILSQNDSCEVMRRMDSEKLAKQMMNFIGITRYMN